MRTMQPTGTSHALPERMGRVNSWISSRGAFWMALYELLSTVSGEPSLERYAGTGAGRFSRALRRS